MATVNFGFCECCHVCPGVCLQTDVLVELKILGTLSSDTLVSGTYTIDFFDTTFTLLARWVKTFDWDSDHCFNEREFTPDDLVSWTNNKCIWSNASATLTASTFEHGISDDRQPGGDGSIFCHDTDDFSVPDDVAPSILYNSRFPFEMYVTSSQVTNNTCDECEEREEGGINGYNNTYRLFKHIQVDPTYSSSCRDSPCTAITCVESSGVHIFKNLGEASVDDDFPMHLMLSLDGVIDPDPPLFNRTYIGGDCTDADRDVAIDAYDDGSNNCSWNGSAQDGLIVSGGGEMWYVAADVRLTKIIGFGAQDITIVFAGNDPQNILQGSVSFIGTLGVIDGQFDTCSGLADVTLSRLSSTDSKDCDYSSSSCTISVI